MDMIQTVAHLTLVVGQDQDAGGWFCVLLDRVSGEPIIADGPFETYELAREHLPSMFEQVKRLVAEVGCIAVPARAETVVPGPSGEALN